GACVSVTARSWPRIPPPFNRLLHRLRRSLHPLSAASSGIRQVRSPTYLPGSSACWGPAQHGLENWRLGACPSSATRISFHEFPQQSTTRTGFKGGDRRRKGLFTGHVE